MRVAIYARRSTEEHQAASLDVQLAEARAFAAARGWRVLDEHVYTDSGVSRAEFKKRPGLIAMLNAAQAHAFDVVVMRDESRLGGDMHRSGLLIQDLSESSVQLWYYSTGEHVRADDLTSRLIIAVRGFAAELEREKIAGRTREHLKHKAARGLNVGGRTYGYDNVETHSGAVREVQYRINAEQAAVVREIFRRWNDGESIRDIAHALNDARQPSPHSGRRGSGTWSPTTVLNTVRNPRYAGRFVWGLRGSQYRGGTRVETRTDAGEWVVVERPELALIDLATWEAAQARGQTLRIGPSADRHVRALLAGLLRCECGGPISTRNTKSGKVSIRGYGCGWARDRGPAVCTRTSVRPAAEIDGAVLGWLREHVLSPAVVDAIVEETRALLGTPRAASVDARPAELARLRREAERLTTAIACSDDPPAALVAALRDRELRARALEHELAASPATGPAVPLLDVEALRAWVLDVRAIVAGALGDARRAIASLLRAPIAVTVERIDGRPRWRLTGEWILPWPQPATPGVIASLAGPEQSRGISVPFSFVARAA
jgi:DNA invertase Pin-like site-specific DNA recombinase